MFWKNYVSTWTRPKYCTVREIQKSTDKALVFQFSSSLFKKGKVTSLKLDFAFWPVTAGDRQQLPDQGQGGKKGGQQTDG